jgi:hypothetical protein
VVFAQALKPCTRKELGMRMTKDDVLAFREGQRVHLLRSHKNATIAERKEILDADGTQVVGVLLVFQYAEDGPLDPHEFSFDSAQPWVTEVRLGWRGEAEEDALP